MNKNIQIEMTEDNILRAKLIANEKGLSVERWFSQVINNYLKEYFMSHPSNEKKPLIDMKTINEAVISPHNIKHNEQTTISAYIDPKTNNFIGTNYDER